MADDSHRRRPRRVGLHEKRELPTCWYPPEDAIVPHQRTFFDDSPLMPPGFLYEAELVSRGRELEIVDHGRALPSRDFECRRHVGKRRVISFGCRCNFNDHALHEVEEMPPFLLPLRDAAARLAALPAAELQHVLITE